MDRDYRKFGATLLPNTSQKLFSELWNHTSTCGPGGHAQTHIRFQFLEMYGSRKWPVRRKKWRTQRSTVTHQPTKKLLQKNSLWRGFRRLNNLGSSACTAWSTMITITHYVWVPLRYNIKPLVQHNVNTNFRILLSWSSNWIRHGHYYKVMPWTQQVYLEPIICITIRHTLRACVKQMCWN